MKEITEKQINAIKNLVKTTGIEIANVEGMSSYEASQVITELIEKARQLRGNRNAGRKPVNNSYKSDALAGLAVKILAQRCKVEDIVGKAERFRNRAVELFKVFDEARRACLA